MIQKRLCLLGAVHVATRGDDVPRFRSQRTIALLGYLVAEGRPLRRDALASLFWPDEAPSAGRGKLRRELHNLAQVLPDCWRIDRTLVTFSPCPDTTVDIYVVQQLEEHQRWQEAAELLRGEFLEGVWLDENLEFETWLLGERERWRGRAQGVLTRVIEGYTRRGRYADALRYVRRLLQHSPWNEGAHRRAMRLLAWTGQRGAALRQYEVCREALWEELGVEPDDEMTALHEQILAGKLDTPPPLPAFLTEDALTNAVARPLFVARERELGKLDGFLRSALAGQGRVVFIIGGPGRGKTALIDAFARRAMAAHPDLLVARGFCNAYSGVGDPYLPFRQMMDMLTGDVEAQWAAGAISGVHARRLWAALPLTVEALLEHGPHLLQVFASGPALLCRAEAVGAGGDAGWLDMLRERITPEPSGSDIKQAQIFHQFSNVLAALAEARPLLLLLDDVQWADTGSISLLFHLGRRLADAKVPALIACAYRPEEVALDAAGERHPLQDVLAEFKRQFGDVWIDLAQADWREGRRFVDAYLDNPANPLAPNRLGDDFRRRLYQHTQGHPLFTIELLRAMQQRGDLHQDSEADGAWIAGAALDWETLPARVEAVIEARVGRLDGDLRDVLRVASVEGEQFTAQVVAQVSDLSERKVLRALTGELGPRRHRLVRDAGELQIGGRFLSRYQFAHALFQEYMYHSLSAAERRLLHSRVGEAIEANYAGDAASGTGKDLDAVSGRLAAHYEQAGLPERAIPYYRRAAAAAQRVHANQDALALYRRGLDLVSAVSPDGVWRETAAQLHEGLGDVLALSGQQTEARAAYRGALERVSEDHLLWRSRLQRRIGKTWETEQLYEEAEHAYDLAEGALGRAPEEADSDWWGKWTEIHVDRMWLYYWQDRIQPMTASAHKAQPVVERCGTPAQRFNFAFVRYLMILRRDRYVVSDELLDYVEAELGAGQELGDLSLTALAQFGLGFAWLWRGDYARAEKALQAALELTERIGDLILQVRCLTYLTLAHRKRGHTAETRRYVARSLELARTIQMPEYVGMAEANLAWLAWRAGNLLEAQRYAEATVETWQQMSLTYPFQWAVLWPLIAVVLAQPTASAGPPARDAGEPTARALSQAVDYARALLGPTQRPMPDALVAPLQRAIQAWEGDRPETTRRFLERAVELAQELGYL